MYKFSGIALQSVTITGKSVICASIDVKPKPSILELHNKTSDMLYKIFIYSVSNFLHSLGILIILSCIFNASVNSFKLISLV